MENEFYYNTVLASLAKPKSSMPLNKEAMAKLRGWFSRRDKDVIRAVKSWEYDCNKARQILNRATPVRLDNTVLRHIAELSVEPIEKLMKLMPQAQLPFDDMWIEWDDHERQKIFHEVYGAEIKHDLNEHSKDVGLLVTTDNSLTDTAIQPDYAGGKHMIKNKVPKGSWHAEGGYAVFSFFETLSHIWEGESISKGTSCSLVTFTLCPDGNSKKPHRKRKKLSTQDKAVRDRQDQSMRNLLFAETYTNNALVSPYPKKLDEYFDLHLCPLNIPTWNEERLGEALSVGMKMMAGDARFLLCTLALLNYPHIVKLTATSPSKTRRIRFGAVVPRKEVKVVEIELPKSRAKTTYKRLFTGQGTPKRLHQRRGHWRVYVNEDGTERKPIWIAPMWVGNEDVGIIEHKYELKGRGQA